MAGVASNDNACVPSPVTVLVFASPERLNCIARIVDAIGDTGYELQTVETQEALVEPADRLAARHVIVVADMLSIVPEKAHPDELGTYGAEYRHFVLWAYAGVRHKMRLRSIRTDLVIITSGRFVRMVGWGDYVSGCAGEDPKSVIQMIQAILRLATNAGKSAGADTGRWVV